MDEARQAIRRFLGLTEPAATAPALTVHDALRCDGFTREAVSYVVGGERVAAFFFRPETPRRGAVVALHQHNSQWHLGKSEVAGLAGDPLQAFGPALARAGVTVLAPDAIGFETRRGQGDGRDVSLAPRLEPAKGSTPGDWLQYYNHAMHRLARGEVLMRELLRDVAAALDVLSTASGTSSIGVVGHSHGGIVALFAAALDERIAFAVSSGALCSYRYKFDHGVGLDMSLVIPGFAARFDVDALLECVAPRPLLVVSSEDDPLSADADTVVERARPAYGRANAEHRLEHLRTPGGHALDQRRFDAIVQYVSAHAGA
jgi:dienelactone hydrolase